LGGAALAFLPRRRPVRADDLLVRRIQQDDLVGLAGRDLDPAHSSDLPRKSLSDAITERPSRSVACGVPGTRFPGWTPRKAFVFVVVVCCPGPVSCFSGSGAAAPSCWSIAARISPFVIAAFIGEIPSCCP